MSNRNFSIFVVFVFLLSSFSPAFATDRVRVLVIDSGSDFTHDDLKDHAFPNLAELNGKPGVDDDGNGLIDDIYGWNFVDNDNVLVNLDDTPPEYDRVLRSMELLGKLQAYGKEGMAKEEFNWLVKQNQDKKFWAWVGFVGGWAHGTHCAGTVILDNNDVALNAIKHLPTGNGPKATIVAAFKQINHMMSHGRVTRSAAPASNSKRQVPITELEKYFAQLGQQYAQQVKPKADYIASLKPNLINCSFGTENSGLLQMMRQNMVQHWGFVNPSEAEVQKIVNLFVTRAFLPRDKALFAGVPKALIFIAAGNSSTDLDPFVTSPNCVPISNKIVIAATDEDQKIAPFSDYGVETVDVAVPGVNIYATYPNQAMGYMSGTSMACPMAVQFASRVLQVRPNLEPKQLKKILMETVDKKSWLKDKVRSGGVINVHRAMYAAKLINEGKSIFDAIRDARVKVSDKAHKSLKKTRPDLSDEVVRELYFSVIQ